MVKAAKAEAKVEEKAISKKVELPELNVGFIGHVDHGKTTLVAALSGKWLDVHSEEIKRGITIKLGYADIKLKSKMVSLIDAPGHETLMAVMISGAAIMDAALLLCAANEPCPQPQTREHLAALKILGIEKIIIVQNKIDLVTKAQALENYKQIKDFAKESLGFDVPIIPVSAQKKVNIDILLEAMDEFFKTPDRNPNADPEMLIARSFDINKPGTNIDELVGGVIGGAIVQGIFKKGMEIELKPGLKKEGKQGQVSWEPIKTKINSIVVGSILLEEKGPGGSIAFSTNLDPALTKADSFVGNIAGLPGKLPEVYERLELEMHLFDKVLGIKEDLPITQVQQREPLMLSLGTSTTLGVVARPGKRIIAILKRPVCARKGTKVAISRQIRGRWHLIGYGVIQ